MSETSEATNIGGVFLNSEEAIRLWFAMKALNELGHPYREPQRA
jgi:hypothetical protein